MGTRVGQYLLFETIGRGAFGKVKLGVHSDTGEQVAVKILEKSLIKQHDLSTQVRREIAIMKALKHKNIVNLHTVLTSKTKLYIVMDLVTGGELFQLIAAKGEGGLDEPEARRFFQMLVDGTHYCHRRGVCHRDIKPENLLLAEDGELKLTDFGLSSIKGASTASDLLTTQCGTPSYVPPEIILHAAKGYSGQKVDAWACGIMLYAMLTGYLPFDGEDISELFMNIQTQPIEYPQWVSKSAIDLMERLLEKDPVKRWDLRMIKRHPWFVIDYDGDDAPHKKRKIVKEKPKEDELQVQPKEEEPLEQPKQEVEQSSVSEATPTVHAEQKQAAPDAEVEPQPDPESKLEPEPEGKTEKETEPEAQHMPPELSPEQKQEAAIRAAAITTQEQSRISFYHPSNKNEAKSSAGLAEDDDDMLRHAFPDRDDNQDPPGTGGLMDDVLERRIFQTGPSTSADRDRSRDRQSTGDDPSRILGSSNRSIGATQLAGAKSFRNLSTASSFGQSFRAGPSAIDLSKAPGAAGTDGGQRKSLGAQQNSLAHAAAFGRSTSLLSSRISLGSAVIGSDGAANEQIVPGGDDSDEETEEEQKKLSEAQRANLQSIRHLETLIAFVKHKSMSREASSGLSQDRSSGRLSGRPGMPSAPSIRMGLSTRRGSVMLQSFRGGMNTTPMLSPGTNALTSQASLDGNSASLGTSSKSSLRDMADVTRRDSRDSAPKQFSMLLALWDGGHPDADVVPSKESSDAPPRDQTLSAVKYVREVIEEDKSLPKEDADKIRSMLTVWQSRLELDPSKRASDDVSAPVDPEQEAVVSSIGDDTLTKLQQVLRKWDATILGDSAPSEVVTSDATDRPLDRAGSRPLQKAGMQDSIYQVAEPSAANVRAVDSKDLAQAMANLDDVADDDFELGLRKGYLNDAWKKALVPAQDSFMALNDSGDGASGSDDEFVEAQGEQRALHEVLSSLRVAPDPRHQSIDVQRGSEVVDNVPEPVVAQRNSSNVAAPSAPAPAPVPVPAQSALSPPKRGLHGRIGYTPSVILDPARGGFAAMAGSAVPPPVPSTGAAPNPRVVGFGPSEARAEVEDRSSDDKSRGSEKRASVEAGETFIPERTSSANDLSDGGTGDEAGAPTGVNRPRKSSGSGRLKSSLMNSVNSTGVKKSKVFAMLGLGGGSKNTTLFYSGFDPERCLVELGKLLTREYKADVARKRGALELKARIPFQGTLVFTKVEIAAVGEHRTSVCFKRIRDEAFDPQVFMAFFDDVRLKYSDLATESVLA
uniref:non-specific serine/threonine protein kinase n=1 Tax=Timspurckia oligopyrenoides TaxID=708627 RepID=A0A7S0ZG41_9RHOD